MSRPAGIALGVGLLGLAGCILAAASGQAVMASYLAVWLFCLALPTGALPVLMLLELLGVDDWAIIAPLRRFLPLLPAASLFAIPIMLRTRVLYMHAHGASAGRMIAMLAVWSVLAFLFFRPARLPRRALAALGLCLHLVIGTFAAVEWIMLLDPGITSSSFGLLAISGEVLAAICAALFIVLVGDPTTRRRRTSEAVPLLLVALGGWMFLHFTQFLIVWSADLPQEIVWYQHRIGGLGAAALWFGAAALVIAFVALLTAPASLSSAVLASVCVMLLLLHLVETLWLVTPSLRHHFALSLPDLLATAGLVGLASCFLIIDAARHAKA